VPSGAYMDDATRPVLGWQLDGAALGDPVRSIYVAYNRDANPVRATLPAPPSGLAWYRVLDTSSGLEAQGNIAAPGDEYRMQQAHYDLAARSLAVFIAR
jgi:hypothetical protein